MRMGEYCPRMFQRDLLLGEEKLQLKFKRLQEFFFSHSVQFKMQKQSQLASLEASAKESEEKARRIRQERDEALREVQHLKKLLTKKEKDCQTAEEELMKARMVGALKFYLCVRIA